MIGNGGHAKVIKEFAAEADIIAVGDNANRKAEADAHIGQHWDVVVHQTAVIPRNLQIGEGTVIMAGAVIQPGARIGKHCIINTLASVDHDSVLEDFVHIAPGAHLCGNVHVGEGTLVGVGVGIAPNSKIPAWSIVKAKGLEICPIPIK